VGKKKKKDDSLQRLWHSGGKEGGPLKARQLNPNANSAMVNAANAKKTRIEFYAIASQKSAAFFPLDVSYSEALTLEWNHESVYGRNDPLSTFSGTKRNITLEFKVGAWTQEDAIANMIEVSALMAMMYPVYEATTTPSADGGNTSQLRASPLMRVHFNNLIIDPTNVADNDGRNARASKVGLVCAFSSLNITPDFEAGMVQIDKTANPRRGSGWKESHISPDGKRQDNHMQWPGHDSGRQHSMFFEKRSKWFKGHGPDLSIIDSRLYPKVWTVSCSLAIFHTFPLGFGKGADGKYYSRVNKAFGQFPYGEKHTYLQKEKGGALGQTKKNVHRQQMEAARRATGGDSG